MLLYTFVSYYLYKFPLYIFMLMPQMINLKAKIFVFVSLLLVLPQAMASTASTLYDVEVLVADESADTRWRVFKEGLEEVFIRISGDSIVMNKLKRPAASRYIKQYSYDPVANPVVNDNDEILAHRLKIHYNGSAMAKYLRDNGFPVWGEHRPDVVIWLAIRDGRNEYVLKNNDQSLLKTAADNALKRRGIPDRWPLYDAKDRKLLKVADIRGGFRDPVTAASKRYSSGPALTGGLIWNGQQWQSSWSLLMDNANRHWSIVDTDYTRLINKAIDQAADAMGIAFATHGVDKNQQLVTVRLQVQAVDSIKKYHRLEDYLRDLSAVAQVRPLEVDGQNATFEVTLRSNEEEFFNLIKNDAELIEAQPIEASPIESPPVETPKKESVVPESGNQSAAQNAPAGLEQNTAVVAAGTSTATTAESGDQALLDESTDRQEPQAPVYYYRLNH